MTKFFYQSPQNQDVQLCKLSGSFNIRYAHGRSMETRRYSDIGQDYMTLFCEDEKVGFSVCDGVSMSYFGDAAARFLGDRLLNCLKEEAFLGTLEANGLDRELNDRLEEWVEEASRYIQEIPFPNVNPFIASVLEQKRAHGSETTFISGRIDFLPNGQGRLMLFWQGDSRIRLWLRGEEIDFGSDAFRSERRWSSRAGCIGGDPSYLEIYFYPQDEMHLLAYTDGLSGLDTYSGIPTDSDIDLLFEQSLNQPTSDDMSFLHIEWPGQRRL